MVILFVTPMYEERGEAPKGGVSMYIRRVAGALKEFGHTPIILSSGTRDMHYVENGIDVYFKHCPSTRFRNKQTRMIGNALYSSLVINKKIYELVREKKIDIIQFSSIRSWPVFYRGNVPAVMRLSSYDKLYYRDFPNKRVAYMRAFLERLASRRCTAVFAPSSVHAKAFEADIHRKVAVIESPFWNECGECDESVYQSKLRDKKYFLFFGRLTVTKGILVIAEVLERFLHAHSEYYFVCCGIAQNGCKENLESALRRGAGRYQERFIYMKALPHNLLYPIIKGADFVICPSLSENFSNTCMEAMYFERVVIGTDGASYEQLIEDGKNGLLCNPGDAEGLLCKMEEAADMSVSQKERMGRMAKRRIDQLKPEIMVRKLLRYYQYVIDHTVK